MAVAREATPVESAEDVKQADLDSEDLLQIYRNMLITRGIEERGHILYRQGKIPGSFYTGRGNEGASVGVATAMQASDVGTPIQRDMGVHVTRGTEPWRVFAQYMGRSDGPAAGKDGNVHMADIRLGLGKGSVLLQVDLLAFQSFEEAFCFSVVIRIAFGRHASQRTHVF